MPRTSDTYLKLLTAIFVAAAAFLSARLVSQVVAGAVWVPRTPDSQVAEKLEAPAKTLTEGDYQIIQNRNLFNENPPPPGAPLADATPVKPAGPAAPAAPAAPPAPPPPTVDFTLVGTVVMSKGASTAIFTRGDQTLIKKVGMEVTPGIMLSAVAKERVTLTIGTDKSELMLFQDKTAERTRARGRTASGGGAGAGNPAGQLGAVAQPGQPGGTHQPGGQTSATGNENIKQIADNSWAIDRKEVDTAVANLSQLITQLRVVPNLVDGQTQGFKVFNIRPGSLFAQIGLVDGDVIREINGTALSGIDVAYQAMSSLQSLTSLQVGITRANQPITLSYEIR